MTISKEQRATSILKGNGASVEFPFGFKVFNAQTDISVFRAESKDSFSEEQVSRSAYSVTLNSDQENNPGGVVVFTEAPANGTVFVIRSSIPNLQGTSLTNHDRFLPEVLNEVHDKLTAMVQQLDYLLGRCLVVPSTSEKTPQQVMGELLDVAARANEYAQKAEALYNETKVLRDYVGNAWSAVEQAKAQIDVAKVAIDAALARHEEILASWEQIGQGVEEILPHVDDIKVNALHIDEIHRVGQDLQGVESDTLDCGWVNEPTDKICTVTEGYIKKVAEHIDDCVHPLAESIDDVHKLASKVDDLATIASDLNGTSLPSLDLGWVTESVENIPDVEGGYIKAVIGVGEDIAKVGAAVNDIKNVSENLQTIETAEDFLDRLNEVDSSLQSKVDQVEAENKKAGFSFRYAAEAQTGGISLEQITPSTNVKVGDHVLNANGELFDITEITENNAVLGASLTTLKGEKGDQGASLTLKGRFETETELLAAALQGTVGDAYIVGRKIFFWSDENSSWVDGGDFCGPKGETGTTPVISATAITLDEDESATVIKSGTDEEPCFEFGIPKGFTPKISVITEILEDGDSPSVTKSGTDAEPVFTFGLPKAFTLPDSGVEAGTYGPDEDASGYGAQIQIPEVTVDSQGRITSVQVRTLTVPAEQTSISGNAGTASRLAQPRVIAASGAVSGSAQFDGSGNISIVTTLENIDLGGL